MGNVLTKTTSLAHRERGKESITPLQGAVIPEMKRCGRPTCRCKSGNLHGPYYYHYYRQGGRLRKRYVRPGDLESVRDATEARRRMVRESNTARRQLRLLLAALKGAGLWGS
ncbi:MAG: hypothetical protein M3Q29_21710 [Chloroflexota bacterium]|nr:hypothetical protein [Chloroflexota bacterium]